MIWFFIIFAYRQSDLRDTRKVVGTKLCVTASLMCPVPHQP